MIHLRGMTWQHRRALDPLVASLPRFRAEHPGIDIEWSSRSLVGFEIQPVEQLAKNYDLIILDHPFTGDAARKGYLLRLDEGLAGQDSDYIGPSLATYRYDGATYAVPVDAACQVAVFRPDLMSMMNAAPPKTWAAVLALGGTAARNGLKLAIGLSGVHSLMTFFTLMAGLGRPCAEAWNDAAIDRDFGGCFTATRASLEGSWIRPRYPGYLGFQEHGGMLVEHHLRGDLGETDLLMRLHEGFAASRMTSETIAGGGPP